LAQSFAAWVDGDPEFERMAPAPFSTVCFRALPVGGKEEADRLNEALLEAVNRTGEVFLSHTRLRGRLALRLAVGNIRTDEPHVQLAWTLLKRELRRLRRS
jgi:aromatic-L-amino-acid decarboxylase